MALCREWAFWVILFDQPSIGCPVALFREWVFWVILFHQSTSGRPVALCRQRAFWVILFDQSTSGRPVGLCREWAFWVIFSISPPLGVLWHNGEIQVQRLKYVLKLYLCLLLWITNNLLTYLGFEPAPLCYCLSALTTRPSSPTS